MSMDCEMLPSISMRHTLRESAVPIEVNMYVMRVFNSQIDKTLVI